MTFPSAVDFLLKVPLYDQYDVIGQDVWGALDLIYYSGSYDCYCTECKRDATFHATADVTERPQRFQHHQYQLQKKFINAPPLPVLDAGVIHITGGCTRAGHKQRFTLLVSKRLQKNETGKNEVIDSIQKIGQYPSFADLNLGRIKDYSGVLSKAQLGELSRAIGLASHDVGIGAYVYLRRIFESLVEEAHKTALSDSGWDEAAYAKMRMGEKILALAHHLPALMAEHPEMYAILSKGIHELTEKECLDHFETLRIGIELILDEKLEAAKKAAKMRDAKAAIAKAHSSLKKGA